MIKDVKILTKHTLTYGIGGLINGLARLAFIPIVAHYLSPDSFGIYSILLMVISFLFLFFDFGLSYALMKWLNEHKEPEARPEIIGTTLSSIIGLGGFVCIVVILLSPLLSKFLFRTPDLTPLVRIAVFIALCWSIFQVLLSILRASAKSRTFIVFTSVRGFSNVVLTFVFVIFLSLGIKGFMWGALLSFCLAIGVFLLLFFPPIKFTLQYAKHMLRYGLPLMPSNLALWVLMYADIYLLKTITTLREVGLYQFAMEICAVISLVLVSFERAWPQFIFSRYQREDAPQLFRQISTVFYTVLVFVGVTLILFRSEIFSLLSASIYLEASRIIPLLVCSGIVYGMYYVFSTGLLVREKTIFFPFITLSAAILNILLNCILIPKYGIVGAGFATVGTNCAMAVGTLILSNRYYSITFDLRKMCIVGCVGVLILVVENMFRPIIPMPFLLKLTLMVCYGIFLYMYELSHVLKKRNSVVDFFEETQIE